MAKRRRSPGAGVYSINRSLLSGLLVCGVCGSRMHLDRRKAKGHTYETYYCNGYHIGIRREIIEDLVIQKAIEILSGEQWQNDVQTLTDGLCGVEDDQEYKLTLEREIAEIDRKLTRLCDILLTTDRPPETLTVKMTELEEQRKDTASKLIALDSTDKKDKILNTAEKVRLRILSVLQSDASADEKREALGLFIPEITVFPEGPQSCKCIIKHGLPGFLVVAGQNASSEKRPSNSGANTRNILTEVVVISRNRSLS